MTDDHLLDELASAHLDGTTSPEEAAEIEADPALQARVDELRAVRDAVRALPPVDAARRDQAIAVAVAAFEQDQRASVTPLASVAARRGPSPTALRVLGVAAAVVLLAALAPLLGRLGDDEEDDTAARSEAAEEESGQSLDVDDSEAPAAGSTSDAGSTTTADERQGSPTDLGSFEDLDALAASIRGGALGQANTSLIAPEAMADEAAGCPARVSEASSEDVAGIEVATATVALEPVVVLVVTDIDGTRSLRVFRYGTCSPVEQRALP